MSRRNGSFIQQKYRSDSRRDDNQQQKYIGLRQHCHINFNIPPDSENKTTIISSCDNATQHVETRTSKKSTHRVDVNTG